jgi:AcrR family transcriptional regulator
VPKVQPEYLEQRRQQVLDAAAACFARRGFHQTTMQDICNEVDLSPGAVYRYFRSKEEIIEGICTMRQQQNSAAIDEAMGKGSTIAVLDELMRAFFIDLPADILQETCALFLETISEAPRNERIRAMMQRNGAEIRGHLTELIRQSQAKGDFNPGLDAEGVARVMVSLYHGFVTQKLVDPDFDVQAYGQAIMALFEGDFWQGAEAAAEQRALMSH